MMKKIITHTLAVVLGFGACFLIFQDKEENTFVLTLGDIDQMSSEELYKFLANDQCAKVTDQSIECEL